MKKYIKRSLAISILGIISILGYSVINTINHKNEVAERIQTLPAFSFTTLEGNSFSDKEINKSQPTLFVYFNSDCDFCHGEAQQIQENLDILKDIQLVFVSFEAAADISIFAKKYGLNSQGNIVFLEDEKMQFKKLFDANSIPFMALYSKDNKLIRQFKGATKIEKIIAHL